MPNPTQPSRYRLSVGVAVAATTATVAWTESGGTPRRSVTIDQTPQGFALFCCSSAWQTLVIFPPRPWL